MMNTAVERRTFQEESKSMKITEKNKMINTKNTTKDMNLLHGLNKDRKQSASIGDLKAKLKPKTSSFDKKTQASSSSGQNSVHGSPVFKALEIEEGDKALDPIVEIPSISERKATATLLKPSKTHRPYFCVSSFKAAPKARDLPASPF